MDAIRIKPYFSIITHTEDMVELKHGVWNTESHMLQDNEKKGVLAQIVLALGHYTHAADIVKLINVKRSIVESVLDYLQQLGVLQSASESFLDYYIDLLMPTLKYNDHLAHSMPKSIVLIGDQYMNQKIYHHLQNFFETKLLDIELIDASSFWMLLERAGDDWLFDALEQQRFISQFETWRDKFIVFAASKNNPVITTRLNRIMYELNIAWLHLVIDGPFILIGPTFKGRLGACYDCFETRVGMNLREHVNYQKYKNAIVSKQVHIKEDPLLTISSHLLIAHATLEILNYVTTLRTFTLNKILTIFIPTMEFVYHDLLRLPACRTCGSVAYRDNTQMYFDFQRLVNEGL